MRQRPATRGKLSAGVWHPGPAKPGKARHRFGIATRQIPALAADPSNEKAWFWNPAGASLEEALAALGAAEARLGVVGATDVFGLFLDLYDVFHLSRAAGVRLPGGRPVFPGVPARTPEAVLAANGLDRGTRRAVDPAKGLTITSWRRTARTSR